MRQIKVLIDRAFDFGYFYGDQSLMFGPDAIHGEMDTLLCPVKCDDYRERLRRLDDLTPIRFPARGDPDDQLHPNK